MSQTEFDPGNHGRDFREAEQAFLDNERAKAGLPPVEKAMIFVDSPDIPGEGGIPTGQYTWDEVEGDD